MVDWKCVGCLWNDEGSCYYTEESLGGRDGQRDFRFAELGHGDFVQESGLFGKLSPKVIDRMLIEVDRQQPVEELH